jgi:hypothetical protein
LIPTVLLLDFLSLKNDVNVPSKRNKEKNLIGEGPGQDLCVFVLK